jgi:hypothetical protein
MGFPRFVNNLPVFHILQPDGTRQVRGLAFFDRWIYHLRHSSFILASRDRKVWDRLYFNPPPLDLFFHTNSSTVMVRF